MSSKKSFFIGAICGIIGLAGANMAVNVARNGISSASTSISSSVSEQAQIDSKINAIYQILDSYYVGDYDKDTTLESMYRGLVSGVGDVYTAYYDPESYQSFIVDTEGSYTGLGIVVSIDESDNRIMVVSPFENSPAAEAGILPGDKIIRVNGNDVSGDILDEAVAMMKGEEGTTVDVTIYRDTTGETLEMTIERRSIEAETVTHKMLEGDIGYLRITQFDRVTLNQFTAAYDDLTANNMKGLIIDLRNNPGGLLDVVCDITDLLVPEGTIVYTEDKYGNQEFTTSDANHIEVPLLILVNGNSASASEVMSGAVKDLGVGELVGETTFGKGLVQSVYALSDGSAVKVTIAKYYTPSGVCIQGTGIEPNYYVALDEDLTTKISTLTLEEDTQLSEAIRVMNEKISG